MVEIIWIRSQAGTLVPSVNHYIFHSNSKTRTEKIYWRCSNKSCSARLISSRNLDFSVEGSHMHTSDADKIFNLQLKEIIQDKLFSSPFLTGNEVFNIAVRELANFYDSDMSKICRFPSFDSLKTSIYRFKAKVFPSSILDESTLDCNRFELPNNRNMLMFSDFSSEKMIIMGEHDYISRFALNPNFEIVMDGTFKSSSRSFFQLYILYGFLKGQAFPLIYCFLGSKTEDTYVKMLTAVKYRLGLRFEPRKIQIDFEYAAFNAIRTVFPETVISGCFFHFGQAIWRKINTLGLSTLYEECESFRNSVQSITSLALIPLDHIDHCWSYIVENCNVRSVTVNAFFEYVETNWINPSRPLFNREIWSQYGNLRGRTNNSAEGFNSKLNRAIQKTNPNFWEIVDRIKEIQIENNIELSRLLNGGEPKKRKKKYIEQDKMIQRLWELYHDGLIDIYELLGGLKNAIKLDI